MEYNFIHVFDTLINLFLDIDFLSLFVNFLPFVACFIFINFILKKLVYGVVSQSSINDNKNLEAKSDYDDFTKLCESDLDYYGITPKKEEKLSFYQKLKRKYSKEDF